MTAGEFFIHHFDFMIHLDIPAENNIGSKIYSSRKQTEQIDLKNVFQRLGVDAKTWSKDKTKYIDIPAELSYTITKNSESDILKTEIIDEKLYLLINPNNKKITNDKYIRLTIRATDYINRWYDEEDFTVTLKKHSTD